MFSPLGDTGASLAALVRQLGELQHQALIGQRLAPYLAGRDVALDLGRTLGIISQPDRPTFDELAMAPADTRSQFATNVLMPLASLAAGIEKLQQGLASVQQGADLTPGISPWIDEISDGLAIDALRARYIAALYQAAVASGAQQPTDAYLSTADGLLAQAHAIVTRRHASLHSPIRDRLIQSDSNATIYQFGYLKQANELCYWERERAELRSFLKLSTTTEPTCLF
jgi:hypothetical protein